MDVYIIHETSSVIRKNHIERELSKFKFNTKFINDGDKKDIDSTILSKYFAGELLPLNNATSCAYKHFLAYKNMLVENTDFAIVLEDDIYLKPHFENSIIKIIDEVKSRNLSNYLISLEYSNLEFVKSSEIEKDKILYRKDKGRLAGAYLLDKIAAKNMINELEVNKCHLPIDWFHVILARKGTINIYWTKLNLARQGSLDGSINSLIDNKSVGIFRIISFNLQYIYKRILYKLR